MKVPYEIVEAQAFQLIDSAALATSFEARIHYYDAFFVYLESAGWSELEFAAELDKRVDNGWTSNFN